MILVRDVQSDGWQADYQVYTPGGLSRSTNTSRSTL